MTVESARKWYSLILKGTAQMHSTAHDSTRGHAPRRGPRIATIVILILLAAAVAEPVVMYLKLAHQKEQRREAAELALPVKADAKAEMAPAIQ